MLFNPHPNFQMLLPVDLFTSGREGALLSYDLGSGSELWQVTELLSALICKMDIYITLSSQGCRRAPGTWQVLLNVSYN